MYAWETVGKLRDSAAVPHWQSLVPQASRRAVAYMWAHLRALAKLGVPHTGWHGVSTYSPPRPHWPWVVFFAHGRRLLTLTYARVDHAQELAHVLCQT